MARTKEVRVDVPAGGTPSAPSRIRLIRPHGFVDEYGRHRFWRAGDVVGDPHEIALLLERGAPAEPAE